MATASSSVQVPSSSIGISDQIIRDLEAYALDKLSRTLPEFLSKISDDVSKLRDCADRTEQTGIPKAVIEHFVHELDRFPEKVDSLLEDLFKDVKSQNDGILSGLRQDQEDFMNRRRKADQDYLAYSRQREEALRLQPGLLQTIGALRRTLQETQEKLREQERRVAFLQGYFEESEISRRTRRAELNEWRQHEVDCRRQRAEEYERQREADTKKPSIYKRMLRKLSRRD